MRNQRPMAGTFVVVGEGIAVVPNLRGCFFEFDEMLRQDFARFEVALSLAKDGMERILRENVFDVRKQQFLMLLLVMSAEREDRLDLGEKFFVDFGKEIVNVGIDRGTIAMGFFNRWP